MLDYYLKKLNYDEMPEFLSKYLECATLTHLRNISYFCGMDYASKDVYDFKEKITRYDHSLSVALLTWNLTYNKVATIAGLFHDAATPCFSHAIDYMNGDYEKQESTEELIDVKLKTDKWLNRCLNMDYISIEDIINFKNYSVVDNKRPKLCADRMDGIILTGMSLTKSINEQDIDNIIDNIKLYKNENNEDEIGFRDEQVAKTVVDANNEINAFFHSKDDYYMMELLAKMTKYAIDNNYIKYIQLYTYNEQEMFDLFHEVNDYKLNEYLEEFKNMKKDDIPKIKMKKIKVHNIKPIVDGKRMD